MLLSVVATGCGSADEGSAEGTDTQTSPPTTTQTSSLGSTTEQTSAADSSGEPHPCGNGVLDSGEECDDGEANSDDVPDACRTHCRHHRCGDGVLDSDEVCDDGDANGNVADACRLVTCELPTCGDGVVDTGEVCDDGNELWGDTCFACSERFYFLLQGDGTILRAKRSGETEVLVGPTAGLLRIAPSEDTSVLYALQSDGRTQNVIVYDPTDGSVQEEFPLAADGLEGPPTAWALAASGGQLYVAADIGATTRLLTLDPTSGDVSQVLDFAAAHDVGDMVAGPKGTLFVTDPSQSAVLSIDLGSATSMVFADGTDGLDAPRGAAFDPESSVLWVANSPAGAPGRLLSAAADGTVTADSIMGKTTDPRVNALAIDIGDLVLAAMQNEDRIVAVENFDSVSDIFTDQISTPLDLERVELGR